MYTSSNYKDYTPSPRVVYSLYPGRSFTMNEGSRKRARSADPIIGRSHGKLSDSSLTDELLQQLDTLKLLEQDRHETITTQITSIEDMISGRSHGQHFRGTRLESIGETLETDFEVLNSDTSKRTSDHLSTHLDRLMILKSVPLAGLGSPLRSIARNLALQMLRVLLREITTKEETGAAGVGTERSARPSFAVLYQWLSRDTSSKHL